MVNTFWLAGHIGDKFGRHGPVKIISLEFKKIGGTLTWLKMAILGTLSGKTLIKGQQIQYFAAPLTPLHGTLVRRGTKVGNHCLKNNIIVIKFSF